MKKYIWICFKSILAAFIMSYIGWFLSEMFPSEQPSIMFTCGFISAMCVFLKKITKE